MRTYLVLIISLFLISKNAMAASCETTGFALRDGTAVPLRTCSSNNNWGSSAINGNLSSTGYWGAAATRSALKKTMDLSPSFKTPKLENPVVPTTPKYVSPSQNGPTPTAPKNFGMPDSNSLGLPSPQQLDRNREQLQLQLAKLNQDLSQQAPQFEAMANLQGKMAGVLSAMMTISNYIHSTMAFQLQMESSFQMQNENSHNTSQTFMHQAMSVEATSIIIEPVDQIVGEVEQSRIAEPYEDLKNSIGDGLPATPQAQRVLTNAHAALGLALSSSEIATQQQGAAALAISIAASDAIKNGQPDIAETYIQAASTVIDIALGFIPVVSSANDLTQIAFGIATGRSYTGEVMTGTDYALRGFGIVLGLFPAGKLGSILIDSAFIQGSKVLREGILNSTLFNQILKTGEYFGSFVQILGVLAPGNYSEVKQAIKSFELGPMLFKHAVDLTQRMGKSELNTFINLMKGHTIHLTDKWQILTSFKVGTIEVLNLQEGSSIYRWTSDGKTGRFFSPTLIEDPSLAKQILALPPDNNMSHLTEYRLLGNWTVLFGKVAPNFGLPGGGSQIFFMPNLNGIELTRKLK